MNVHVPVIDRPHLVWPGGIQRVYRFSNGYGASVVRGRGVFGGSYTDNDSEWEVAVVRFNGERDDNFDLCYDTPITDDVVGHVRDGQELEELLTRIEELPVSVAVDPSKTATS